MTERVRLVKDENDIKAIEGLFKGEKSFNELSWLLKDPNDPNSYCAYIAEKSDGGIIGMLGFVVSVYQINEKEIIGVIPMSWKVDSDYKGLAAVLLLKKVLSLGVFGMTIQGSEMAQKLYHLVNLEQAGAAGTFMKLLRPLEYFRSLNGRKIINKIGNLGIVFPSYMKTTNKYSSELRIKEISLNEIKYDVPYIQNGFFEKRITSNYLKWMASCPLHKSYVFEIFLDETFLGYSLCYIHHFENNTCRSRIVYKPNFGEDHESFIGLLSYLEKFLYDKGCSSISILGLDANSTHLLRKIGYINYKSKKKPIFLKRNETIDDVRIDNWYMQYTEGDKAYRNI